MDIGCWASITMHDTQFIAIRYDPMRCICIFGITATVDCRLNLYFCLFYWIIITFIHIFIRKLLYFHCYSCCLAAVVAAAVHWNTGLCSFFNYALRYALCCGNNYRPFMIYRRLGQNWFYMVHTQLDEIPKSLSRHWHLVQYVRKAINGGFILAGLWLSAVYRCKHHIEPNHKTATTQH